MAMYYQGGPEIQADGLQTLYLMNPNYIGYTDTHHHHHQQQSANMFFLNSEAAAGNFPHATLPMQAHGQGHLIGVPLPVGFQDPNRPSIQEISASHHGLLSRLWSSGEQNCPGSAGSDGGGGNGNQSHIPSSTVVSPNSGSGGGITTDFASQLGYQRPGLVSPTQAHYQGLSLSLSPQQQQHMNFKSSLPLDHREISTTNHQVGIVSSSSLLSPRTNTNNIDHIRGSGASSSFSISNGMNLGSKYLKVAQDLLDEVVNVGKNIKLSDGLEGGAKEKHKLDNELISLASDDVESSSQKNSVVDLTTAQRQELQMKKAKLVSMLDEVDQRYRQYHHQMQMIAASFEQTAGIGSSKSYTQLALHTISKQFRCLKDAISGQIKDTSKTLGEEENIGGKIEGSKLKFVDHHLRQQRALQQLGMMQTNAWRPQRGLPERAVSVLRAWLFEHFLHPYPKDSDKIMLAKQTGLTRSQVSNWFINARVRLWKPMVEEMYTEEVKKNNEEQHGLDQDRNIVNKNNEVVGSKLTAPQDKLPIHDAEISTSTINSTSPTGGGASLPTHAAAGFSFIGSLNMENIDDQRNNKKPRNDMQNSSTNTILSKDTEMNKVVQDDQTIKSEKFNGNNKRQTRECYPLMNPYTMDDQFGTRFNPNHQQLATTSTFHQGNGHVSLTLGLPPNSENQHNFLPNNQNIGLGNHYNPQDSHHPNVSYENIDFQSGKRYAAQLLQDFVS
ncbi:BEL1-like homeodomain protein 1 [Solanum dulcamara]|uniref:BEL1-like homeodomain protein 1 n=1 Tax=Solanum dulcamara TaxID=45834 RepID=UPI0024855971|nr:BEL1-like homeodomain protein 1 [Solanum dulcamara]XP_055833318.1 BEL1-like homeodomain protein 1 [Solanum dulcamara]